MPRHDAPPARPGNAPVPALAAGALVGLLADEARLRCVAAVVLGASTATEVAERTGLDARTVVRALERLAGAGLVERGPEGLAVGPERFREAARAAAGERPEVNPEDLGATPEQAGALRSRPPAVDSPVI